MSPLLAKIGLPVLIDIVSEALGHVDNPVAKSAEKALRDVSNALDKGGISLEQLAEANRHAETMAQMELEKESAALSQVNESLRREADSDDKFVRRMRPTFGYLMALTWAAQMLAIAYVIVFDTTKAAFVLNAMGSLTAIWTIGLSVLGLYVYKRSEDKKLSAGSSDISGPDVIAWNGPR